MTFNPLIGPVKYAGINRLEEFRRRFAVESRLVRFLALERRGAERVASLLVCSRVDMPLASPIPGEHVRTAGNSVSDLPGKTSRLHVTWG